MERYLTGDLRGPNRSFRNVLEKNRMAQRVLKLLAVLGVCLIIAGMLDQTAQITSSDLSIQTDGVLTPAQSILGAIQGEKMACRGEVVSCIP
jgi:KUP system potassium uptake protein